MDFFGEPGNAPIYKSEAVKQRPVPVGELCCHCEEPIAEGDRGFFMPHIGKTASEKPIHVCCLIREVIGSVGHQQKKCSCYGGIEEDPPGMTKRAAAEAAFLEFESEYKRNRQV